MRQTKRSRTSRIWHIAIICSLLVVVLAVILELTGTTHFFHKQKPTTNFATTPTHGSASTAEQKGNDQSATTSTPSTDSASGGTSTTSSDPLVTPFGDFVSNHTPGQYGSPLVETSVCNTTSGAKCKIMFSNGSITKSLIEQTTDLEGATYWDGWTPASIGLTAGSWQTTAIATLSSQTKIAVDARPLIVQ